MTTRAPSRLTTLEQQIVDARRAQLAARINWARSPNAATIHAAKLADRELDVLLDRLTAAYRNSHPA